MAFKIAHPGVPESANSVADAVTITVLDDDGSLNVDQLTLTGNSNALIRYVLQSNGSYDSFPFSPIYNGLYNGYHFGGDSLINSTFGAPSGFHKFPFASSVSQSATIDRTMIGALNRSIGQIGRGTLKSSTKAYLAGGSPVRPGAALTTVAVFPFAVGDTAGTYAAPMVLPAVRKEAQHISNIPGGFVYVVGGGSQTSATGYTPGTAAVATTFKIPVSSDTGPITSSGSLVTGRAEGTAYSTPDRGFVSGGGNLMGSPTLGLLGSTEIFPWASETWSQTPVPLVVWKMSAGFQSLSKGYMAFGANNLPSYVQPHTVSPAPPGYATRSNSVISFPFAAVGTATSVLITPYTPATIFLTTNRQAMSGVYEGIIAGGWPGLGPPEGSSDRVHRYPYAGEVAILLAESSITDRVDGATTQD
jgi:hypothetical protein